MLAGARRQEERPGMVRNHTQPHFKSTLGGNLQLIILQY